MSNRKLNPETGKKEYVSRAERRLNRNLRRAAVGAPPERPIPGGLGNGNEGTSYVGTTEPYDPVTGEALGPPRPPIASGNQKTAFLIEGVQFVYEGLGGHRGFLDWARTHQTKFRELSLKLLPSQVTIQAEGLGAATHIQHALPPPNYQPSRPLQPVHEQGRIIEVVQTVDVEAVRQALMSLSPEERAELLRGTQEGGNGGET